MVTVAMEAAWKYPVTSLPAFGAFIFQSHSFHAIAFLTFFVLPISTYGMFLQFLPRVVHKELTPGEIQISSSAMQNTLSWGVKLQTNSHRKHSNNRTRLDLLADEIAYGASLRNHGQVGELYGHYLFMHKHFLEALNGTMDSSWIKSIQEETELILKNDPSVEWAHRQWIRRRSKRSVVEFEDPMYPKQWHLHNTKTRGMDINVTDIWLHNITGEGVVVAVIDDGLEWTNPDIRDNYSPQGSCDLNSGDDNPMPELHPNGKNENRHGTRCAGEIAAVANKKCGVGVAFGSKVAGIRLLDGPMTDSLEATAFNKHMQVNDIYSCSWGPDDDGKTVDGPHPLALAALQHGVNSGRRGRGSVFVVASGNGGRNQDNCNYDGYANSMYTITIGAINEVGLMPYYAEECSALLGVTFSSGTNKEHRNIVTTDWTLGKDKGCTNGHTGTSAAAPLAAGLIALSLQAKPCLSWRDVQHLIVHSSFMVDPEHGDWSDNAAGFHHSHKHGFGEIKAWRLVNAAKVWRSVPWLTSLSSSRMSVYKAIPADKSALVLNYKVTNSSAQFNEIATLEHVLVTVSLTHPSRGSLRIELTSPSGTTSVLATPRKLDNSSDGLKGWTFSTVRCWGEQPSGDWILKIFDTGQSGEGILQEWKLVLYGSMISPEEVQQRRQTVEDAMSGVYLDANLTEPCSFYWKPAINEDQLLTTKTMRMLLLVSALITILAAYYTLEQAFCNQEDKDKYLEEYIDLERTRLEKSKASSNGDVSSNDVAETRQVPNQIVNNVELTIETENSLIVEAEISPLSQKGGADSSGKHRQEGEVICADNSKPMSQVHKHSKEKLSETVAHSSSNCEALSTVNLGFASNPFEDGTESGDLELLSDQSAIYKLERTQHSGTINNVLSSHGNEENIDEISECEPFLKS